MTTPCSTLLEKHVVFGGEEKLRDQIASTMELMNGDLFVTVSGCIPALIGDDVEGVVSEFRKPEYPPSSTSNHRDSTGPPTMATTCSWMR